LTGGKTNLIGWDLIGWYSIGREKTIAIGPL
jgi:hypothetical protein